MSGIGVLGPLILGERRRPVRGQAGRCLGVLALCDGRSVPIGELAAWALGEEREEANDRVHVLIARLRAMLRTEAPTGGSGPIEIVTLPGGNYRLDVAAELVDAQRFRALVVAALATPLDARAAILEDALALWRGEVTEGLGLDDHPAAVELRDLRVTAVEERLVVRLADDSFAAGAAEAIRFCRAHVGRERLIAGTVIGLYRVGRPADAVAVLHRAIDALRDERGLEPGEELRQIELALLTHDLDALDVLHQRLVASAAPRAPSPLDRAPLPPAAGSVPHPEGSPPLATSTLIGREQELLDIGALLSSARVVTLVGPGGVGKTRLAAEVAHQLVATERSVRWCELAPVDDPAAVVRVVAAAHGVVDEPDRTLLATLAVHLAARRTVLVIDNCEHLLDPVAGLLQELLVRCPHLVVLATSREPIGMGGEHTFAVAPLALADAVALFRARALAVRATFEVDDATSSICEQLDGLPLALEMAAARLRSMQPAELAGRLDERFRLLVGARGSPSRHQTLRATVSWSHDLLDAPARLVFRRLAVFAGSFDVAAVHHVVGDGAAGPLDVGDVLHDLVSKSLVVAYPDRATTRFSMLETIRRFAHEQLLDAGEVVIVRRRHAEHLTRFVAAAAVELRGPNEPVLADAVDAELDNLRSAFRWAVAMGDAATALALFAPMPYSGLRDTTAHEMFDWIDTALDLPGARTDPNVWLALLWVTGRSANLQRFDDLGPRLDWLGPRPPPRPEVAVLRAMYLHAVAGELEQAAHWHGEGARGFTERGDPYHAVRAAAMVLWCGADPTIEALDAVAEQARALRNPFMTAFGLGAPACAPRHVLRHPAHALALIEEATTWSMRSRNPFMHRAIAGARMLARTLLGDPGAIRLAHDAILASENRNQMAVPIGALSVAFALADRHAEAAEMIGAVRRSLTVHRQLAASPEVVAIWETTRQTLGEDVFDAHVQHGASLAYEEIAERIGAASID